MIFDLNIVGITLKFRQWIVAEEDLQPQLQHALHVSVQPTNLLVFLAGIYSAYLFYLRAA